MAISDFFKNLISKYTPVETENIRGRLPFVHLFGYEKAYGLHHPQDYDRMVAAYGSWVYACIWKNATTVAKNKLCIYKQSYDNKNEEEKLVKIGNHPFLDVINSVNPFSNRFELMTITQIYLELTGNAYWWIPRNALGIPYMIWNIPSNWMKVVPSETKFIEGYVMKVPQKGTFVPFDESEIVHFRYPSPFNIYYGSGPTFASHFSSDLNREIKNWTINYFLNNANPGGVLTTETSLSAEQYQRLRDQWNEKYRGSKNSGKMAFLENGLKYMQTGSTVRDARVEFVNNEMRDEILAMYGVPASKLGLVEDVNRANAEANDYTYQKETIYPRLVLIEEKLNEKMIPIYDSNLVCKFENPIPEDNEFRLREKQINISIGFSTIDEEREREGLAPFNLPETSKPLIPFGLNPAGTKPEDQTGGNPYQQDPKDEEDNEDDKEEKSLNKAKGDKWRQFINLTFPIEGVLTNVMKVYFRDQHGEVMKNLNKLKSIEGAVKKDVSGWILFDQKESDAKLLKVSTPYVRQAIEVGLKLGMADTNSTIDFTLYEPNILRAVAERSNFFVDRVNQATADLIKQEITQAVERGETINDISRRMDKVFNYAGDYRAKRVAQTETIGAANDGQLRAYREAGVEKKMWLTSGDEHVRQSHQINGQIVGITESFQTGLGSRLQYPGDRSSGAPAEDVINCRCTVSPVL